MMKLCQREGYSTTRVFGEFQSLKLYSEISKVKLIKLYLLLFMRYN